jgi:hypothetical protein
LRRPGGRRGSGGFIHCPDSALHVPQTAPRTLFNNATASCRDLIERLTLVSGGGEPVKKRSRSTTRKRKKASFAPARARRPHTRTLSAAAKPSGRRAQTKTAPGDALDNFIMATAQMLRVPIDPGRYRSVKFNVQLILRLAALVDEFPLPDDEEPAPVFHA